MADRTLEVAERLDLIAIVSDVLITRGASLCSIGRPYEGRGALRAGMELADERGLVPIAVRARLNLGVLAPDPKASYDAAEEALTLAQRYGLSGIVPVLVGNLSSAALDVGEWQRGIEALTSARDDSPDELSANYAAWTLNTYLAYQGNDVSAEVQRLTAWAESFDDTGARGAVHGLRAEVAFVAGQFQAACDEWLMHAAGDSLNAPTSCLGAGLAALLAGDQDRAQTAVGELSRLPGHSRMRDADRRLVEAGLAALDGRRSEALREARFALDEYDVIGLPWRKALGGLMLTSTLGAADPEVRDFTEAARETFVRLKARPFLERLDTLLASSAGVGDGSESAPIAGVSAARS